MFEIQKNYIDPDVYNGNRKVAISGNIVRELAE